MDFLPTKNASLVSPSKCYKRLISLAEWDLVLNNSCREGDDLLGVRIV